MAIIKTAKNITINVKGQYTMIAGTITEVAHKIIITATKENLVLGSNKKVVMQGLNGGVKFGNYEPPVVAEKTITQAIWMNSSMETQISNARTNELLSLKVKTQNYNIGEIITVFVKEQEDEEKNIQLIGYVDKDGFAILQEIMYVDTTDLNKNSNLA